MAAETSYRCVTTRSYGTSKARRRRPCRTARPDAAQVYCVAALPDGRVVSGSDDNTLKVWGALTFPHPTLTGHTGSVLRRRPDEPRVDRPSTPRLERVQSKGYGIYVL